MKKQKYMVKPPDKIGNLSDDKIKYKVKKHIYRRAPKIAC